MMANKFADRDCTLWLGDADESEEFYMEAFRVMNEPVISVKIIRDLNTNQSRGYGFIVFKDAGTAQRILSQYNGQRIPNAKDKSWRLNVATRTNVHNQYRPFSANSYNNNNNYTSNGGTGYYNRYNEYSVHATNFPDSINDQDLLNAFKERFASVSHAKVISKDVPNGEGMSPRVYGFVHFKNREDYNRCLTEARTSPVVIRGKEVHVDSASHRRYNNNNGGYHNRSRRLSQQSSYGSVGERTPIASPALSQFDAVMEQVPHAQHQAPQPHMQQRAILPQPQSPMTYQPTYPYPSENNFQVLGYPPYLYAPQAPAYYLTDQNAGQFVQLDANGYPFGMIPQMLPQQAMGIQPFAIDHMQLEQYHLAQAQNNVNGGGDQQQRIQTVPSPHAPSSAYVPSPGPAEASAASPAMAGLSAVQPQLAANMQMQTAQYGTPQTGPYSRANAWSVQRN